MSKLYIPDQPKKKSRKMEEDITDLFNTLQDTRFTLRWLTRASQATIRHLEEENQQLRQWIEDFQRGE